MALKLNHEDMGPKGSGFTVYHPPLKSSAFFLLLLFMTLTIAFSVGLHLVDQNVLAATCLVLVVGFAFRLSSKVHSESLLILPSLGLQVETKYYLGHCDTHFIHLSHIYDIVINEAVTMHSIISYLVVLLRGQGHMKEKALYPLFTHSRLSLADLKTVYGAAQVKLIQQQHYHCQQQQQQQQDQTRSS